MENSEYIDDCKFENLSLQENFNNIPVSASVCQEKLEKLELEFKNLKLENKKTKKIQKAIQKSQKRQFKKLSNKIGNQKRCLKCKNNKRIRMEIENSL